MEPTLTVQSNAPQSGILPAQSWRCVCALGLYVALWGCLCSLGYLSTQGLAPLMPGALLLALLSLLSQKAGRWVTLGAFLAAAALIAIQWRQFWGGCGLYCNRLFEASEARQRYLYERFAVTGLGLDAIRYALLPLGLLSALLCAAAGRFRLLSSILAAAPLLLMAWLGVCPTPIWLPVLLTASLLPFLGEGLSPATPVLVIAALLIGILFLLRFGSVDTGLATWADRARDRLAPQTVAYAEQIKQTEQEEDASTLAAETQPPAAAPALPEIQWRPILIALLILLILTLLFVPAVLSDRLRKQREALRTGLDDADNGTAICASFLYALRHLRLAGLPVQNLPYAALDAEISELFPQLTEAYRAVLPLWQRAAYSDHVCTDGERLAMQRFLQQAQAAAYTKMRPLQRLKCRLTL